MTRDDLLYALQSDNVLAFLSVIRAGESSQDDSAYTVMFGGKHFESFADHPRTKNTVGSLTSTAAGAYQILERTWNEVAQRYDLKDFSPRNQDCAAVALIARRKALDDVLAGRVDQAVAKCALEWASLPGSPYGQPTRTKEQAIATYLSHGGRIAELVTPDVPDATRREVKPMVPFLALLPTILDGLSNLIPALSNLGFGSGSEVAKRNVAAGQMVAQELIKVTDAVNLQDAAEKIQNDPQALQAAKDAVAEIVMQLSEAGSGGIETARKFSATPDQLPFWKQGGYWISIVLIIMPFMLLVDLFYVHPDSYDGNLRTQIATGVMLIISMVGSFWLGSTFGSQKKDAMLGGQK